MDVLTKKFEPLADGLRPLGRATEETKRSKPHWSSVIPAAPHVFSGAGEAAQVSPAIYNYCPAGFNNQVIGCCVGMASKNGYSTLVRIPDGATFDPDDPSHDTPPGPNVRLSGLYCYLNARRKGIELGAPINNYPNDPNGGGAVVAYSLLAMEEHGVVLESDYPDSDAAQLSCSDNPLPQQVYAKGVTHKAVKAVRITSSTQLLDYLSQGIPVVDGKTITQGWMNTADDGKFSLDGQVVGGHATLVVYFNKRTNAIGIRNSWLTWGRRTTDPAFSSDDPQYGGNSRGHDNIGYCALDQYLETNYSPQALADGSTDAFALVEVQWDRPKARITLRSASELFE